MSAAPNPTAVLVGSEAVSEVARFDMTIGGETVPGRNTVPVINPATGRAFAEVPDCSAAELDSAMNAASDAFRGWSGDLDARKAALADCAAAVQANADRLATLLTLEQGKPLAKAAEEIAWTVGWLQYTATLDLPLEVVQDDEAGRVEIRRKPMGVVAAITPWNYPLLIAMWKIAPALLAGNTVVIKPSPYTPVTTLLLGDILRPVLPPGVLNVVSGGSEVGSWMTRHPTPRKVSFTGSVPTGKKVALSAAADLKRVTLELGGNDPAVLLPDVDAAAVAEKIFWSAFENTGQVCIAVKRVYVHESQYQPLVDALAAIAESVRVGDGMAEGVQLGPLNNQAQLERVEHLVKDARARGARVVAGGRRPTEDGFFYSPTIVSDIADGTRLVDEEQFGPALPVVAYRSIDEALERANGGNYGLGGSVWSSDYERAAEVAGRLECGTAWVNQHLALGPNIPFGGVRWSGVGVEHGPWGLLGFTDIQVVNIAKNPIGRVTN